MKYIILPLLKAIYVLTIYTLCVIALIFILLECLWHWDLREFKEFFKIDHFHRKESYVRKGREYTAYLTAWDYIFDKGTKRIAEEDISVF